MITKQFVTLLLLFFSIICSSQEHQNVDNVLKKIEHNIISYGTFEVKFEINGDISFLTVKDNKFKLNNSTIITWYNGLTQWSYIIENNEVNITEPDNSDIETINPYMLLKNWEKKFNRELMGYKLINGNKYYEIKLTPTALSDYRSVYIYSDMNNELKRISIDLSDNEMMDIHIIQLKKNINVSDAFFNFEHKKYNDVQIIDLR